MPGARATTRDDVVAAARAIIGTEGPGAVTMRRLAADLGTSYQVVYSRVGSKVEVLRAVHDEGFAALTVAADVAGRGGTGPGYLRHLAVGYLDFAVAEPRLFDVMFGAPEPDLVRDEPMREVERVAFRRCWVLPTRTWLDEVHPARPAGSATRLAWRLWSAVHGITVLHLAGHRSPSGDPRAEVVGLVDLLLADPLRR